MSSPVSLRARIEAAVRPAGWALLGGLLLMTVLRAAIHDRVGWEGFLPGESTLLMQAESLAYDLDLRYERDDFERFTARWGGDPTDLELVSARGGTPITYDRAFPYALWLAPFVRLWPTSGWAIANALLLALGAVVAARSLERGVGPAAALGVAALIFGSVGFAYVFLLGGDLLRWIAAVLAFACISAGGWLGAGVLLSLACGLEPLDSVLVLAAVVLAAGDGLGSRAGRLVLGLVAGLALQLGVLAWAAGGSVLAPGSHCRFTPSTGFPLVDFPAEEWIATAARLDVLVAQAAPEAAGASHGSFGRRLLALLLGQNVGLVPYFPALLLLLPAAGRNRSSAALALAVLVWVAAVTLLRPFDFWGGDGAALGNRLFLPLYGALWWLPVRRPRLSWGLAAGLVACLTLLPLWQAPAAAPIEPETGYRHVSSLARRLLPWEDGQRFLPIAE